MRRGAPEERLADIAAAGMTWFGRVGYRRAKMAEVAREAGLSAGAVYSYVDSKEALFHLAISAGFGVLADLPDERPLAAPPFDETLLLIDRELKRQAVTPLLKAAAEQDAPADVRWELAEIVAEQYSVIHRLWRVLSVIEACAGDLPPLEELYFGRRRRGQIGLLERYLRRRAGGGGVRPMTDMAVAAQLIHEAVAWFAWKRFEGRDADRFDDEAARLTVIEFCCYALVEEEGIADDQGHFHPARRWSD